MTSETITEIKKVRWERWLERPWFHAFLISFFEDATRGESFAQIGIPNTELASQLFQYPHWYIHEASFKEMDRQVETYLASHTVFDITEGLQGFKERSISRMRKLIDSTDPIEKKFAEVYEMIKLCGTYIWLAHGIDSHYEARLKTEVSKYIKSDADLFIGDASFPKKKNAQARFEEALHTHISPEKLAADFGWLKVRDGFSEPFSVEEIEKMRSESRSNQKTSEGIDIPEPLEPLFEQVQELVFFRTERTDIFYELIYRARPIIKALAKKYHIPFSEMRYFRATNFIQGAPEKYDPAITFVYWNGKIIFQDEPIIAEEKTLATEIKGSIAYKGVLRGVVKIVKDTSELEKVENGDILVTQMTFPAFIPAMIRAAAFVTDEGGITCHAAIVAREMQKPCIIGTKIATQILKDGDLVEVDAEKGVVKILR